MLDLCAILWIVVPCIISAGLHWTHCELSISLVTLAEILLDQYLLRSSRVYIFSVPAFLRICLSEYFLLPTAHCFLPSILVGFIFSCQITSLSLLLLFSLTSLLLPNFFVVLQRNSPVLVILFLLLGFSSMNVFQN